METSEVARVRSILAQELGSNVEKSLTDADVEALHRNYCSSAEGLEAVDLEELPQEPHPVSKQLVEIIRGYRKRKAEAGNAERETKRFALGQPDMSEDIITQLLQQPPSIPAIDSLRPYLSAVHQPIPVDLRTYQLFSQSNSASSPVRVCQEQVDARIVMTFSSRIQESIDTSGSEEKTAYGVTKLLFDTMVQIEKHAPSSLKLGLRFDKHATTSKTSLSRIPERGGRFLLKVAPPLARFAASKPAAIFPVTNELSIDDEEGRAWFLLLTVNIYRLMLAMKGVVSSGQSLGLQPFKKYVRPNGVEIEPGISSMRKTIRMAESYFEDAGTSFNTVQKAYDAASSTPYVVHALRGPTVTDDTYEVETVPLGCPIEIRTDKDLRNLCHDIVHGLSALHAKDICHRDVWTPNIIAYKDTDSESIKYAFIDLETAAKSGAELPKACFSAWGEGTFENKMYTPKSDLFQLCKVINGFANAKNIKLSKDGQTFLEKLGSKQLSAAQLLEDTWLACNCRPA